MSETEVVKYLPLAYCLGSRFQGGIPFDDAKSEATVGLVKASQMFKPERGVEFTTFANRVIFNHLLDVAVVYDPMPIPRHANPEPCVDEVCRKEEYETLYRALSRLTPEVRKALELRFRDDSTYREIGAALGCSDVRAGALVAAGLAKLKRMMA
jgi:RNA polymerase sigma factor (sigma-70 family)